MDRGITALMLALSIGLTGCASNNKQPEKESLSLYQQKVLEEDQRTNEVLSKAAALSAKSLAVFVRTEQAVHQPNMTAEQIRQARHQLDYIPSGMEQKIEYAWDGAPEPLLSAMAMNAGYRLIYSGERPPISMSVTVGSESRMIVEYINIIRQQTSGYIKDIINDDKSNDKTIRVIYEDF